MTLGRGISAICPPVLAKYLERIENSPRGFRLARGMFWSVVGAATSRGLMLLASIVVARMLGREGYGELGIIQSTVGMLGTFAGFGLGLTATKHVAEFRQVDPARAGRIIGLSGLVAMLTGALMALGLLIFAPWLAEHTINAPHLAGDLRISAGMLLMGALNGAQIGALSGLEAFRSIAYVNLSVGLASFPILVVGAYLGGLSGAVWAMTLNLGVNWGVTHLVLRREASRYGIPLNFRSCTRETSILWTFSLAAVLNGAVSALATWSSGALLVNQAGGYSEMGILNAASQWQTILLILPGLLGQVLLPVLSECIGRGDKKQSVQLMTFAVRANAILVVPLAVLGSLASPHIMSLYGADFRRGWPTMVVVLLTAGVVALQTPVGLVIAASGRMWIACAMNTAWALVLVLGTLLLLDHGSLGVATARAIGYLLHTIWVSWFVHHLLTVAGTRASEPVL